MTPVQLQPILQTVLLASALIANLCLFLSLKREFRKESLRQRAALEILSGNLEKFLVPSPAAEAPVISARSALDPTSRLQMLQRLSEGHSPAQITAAFGIPEAEVELLLRVQQMAAVPNGRPVLSSPR